MSSQKAEKEKARKLTELKRSPKDLLQKAADAGTAMPVEELELLLCETVSAKNRYYNRGGFSPYQLVFGTAPRLPQDLLSDGFLDQLCVGTEAYPTAQ